MTKYRIVPSTPTTDMRMAGRVEATKPDGSLATRVADVYARMVEAAPPASDNPLLVAQVARIIAVADGQLAATPTQFATLPGLMQWQYANYAAAVLAFLSGQKPGEID